MKKILFLFIFVLNTVNLYAQTNNFIDTTTQKTKKIGLCLSGGGAKGLAHIGLLRMIDSLGIKIDFLSGTSMGAVVGGLYAMGYSGDQIKEIALDINWRGILNNKTTLDKINVEEKDEYNRYILETPMQNGLPTLPTGAVEGQYIYDLLTRLTLPAHCVRNFDELPIPFHCIAADAIKGEAVVLKKGNLAQSIRASMAIPMIFTPVRMGDKLFIDGGALRNFPVDEVKKMGGEFVIGSYTGFRTYSESELSNAMNFMNRSIGFSMIENAQQQAKLVDVLLNFNQTGIAKYTPTSFKNYQEIIEIGETEARKLLPQLAKIADEQHRQGIVAQRNVSTMPQTIKIAKIKIETDSDKVEISQILNRLKLIEGNIYPIETINNGLDNLIGTRMYHNVAYRLASSDIGEDTLVVRALPSVVGAYKFAVHYDTEQAAGILINLTMRNWLGKHSRASATLDLAQNPRFRLDYYQFLDQKERWWWRFNGFIAQRRFFNYNRGKQINNYDNYYWETKIGIQRTLNKHSYLFANILYSNNYFVFGSDPETFTQFSSLASWAQQKPKISFGFYRDTRNQPFFATKGSLIRTELGYNLSDYNRLTYFVRDSVNAPLRETQSTQYNPQTLRLLHQNTHCFPLTKRTVFTLETAIGVGFALEKPSAQSINLGYDNPEGFYLGGTEANSWRNNLIPLAGFRQTEIRANQFAKIELGLQYSPLKNVFIAPSLQAATIESEFKDFYKGLSAVDDAVFSYGITASYLSPIGPISLNFSKNSVYEQPYLYFSLGFK